eukprot:764387-Hanusia_phi.AAC.3
MDMEFELKEEEDEDEEGWNGRFLCMLRQSNPPPHLPPPPPPPLPPPPRIPHLLPAPPPPTIVSWILLAEGGAAGSWSAAESASFCLSSGSGGCQQVNLIVRLGSLDLLEELEEGIGLVDKRLGSLMLGVMSWKEKARGGEEGGRREGRVKHEGSQGREEGEGGRRTKKWCDRRARRRKWKTVSFV